MSISADHLNQYCAVASTLIRAAGANALAHFRKNMAVEQKGLGEAVTEIDRANERMLRQSLIEHFPETSVLGEEFGGNFGSGGAWVIDPIDGTTNYTRGIAHWCVSIGLIWNGLPVVGVIYDPSHDEMFSAVRGQGAKLNGIPISCSPTNRLASSLICIGLTRAGSPTITASHVAALAQDGASVRSQGAGALTLAHCAVGRVDAFFEHGIHLWDVAAAALILTEAGGRLAHRFDPATPKDGFPLLGTAPGLFDTMTERLAFTPGNGFHATFD